MQLSDRAQSKPSGWIVSPYFWLLFPVGLSFLAWVVPGTGLALRGFSARATFSSGALLVLGGWYVCLVMCLWLGVAFGNRLKLPRSLQKLHARPELLAKADLWTLKWLTVVAIFGIAATYLSVGSQIGIVESIRNSTGNQLREALDGAAGIYTLRYAAILALPLSIFCRREHRSSRIWIVVNAVSLTLGALISSRLSLIASVVVLVFLMSSRGTRTLPSAPKLMAGLLALYITLVGLNFSRNANYYERYGVYSPWDMNNYQILSYLGAPMQVSLGVANATLDRGYGGIGDPVGALTQILPTFLISDTTGVGVQGDARYSNVVSVSSGLTANSAFADVYTANGLWGLMVVAVGCIALGAIYSFVSGYPSGLAMGGGVVLYVLAELWRVSLLGQGIVFFLVGVSVMLPVFAAVRVGTLSEKGSQGNERYNMP